MAIATSAIEIRSPAVRSMSAHVPAAPGSRPGPCRSARRSCHPSPRPRRRRRSRPSGVHDAPCDPLDRVRVGDRRSAVLAMTMPHGVLLARLTSRSSGLPSGGVPPEHLIGDGRQLSSPPTTTSASRRSWATTEQRVERDAGPGCPTRRRRRTATTTAPRGRCRAEVAQPFEVGGDAGQVVGQLVLDRAGHVGIEHVAVGVDRTEHLGQAQPHRVEVGLGPTSAGTHSRG